MKMSMKSNTNGQRGSVRRHAIGRFTLVVTSLIGTAGLAMFSAEPGATASNVSPSPCSTSALRATVATNSPSYQPGTFVRMTFTVLNRSIATCRVALGPASPSFTVTDSSKRIVWNNCFVLDQPGACPQYLVVRNLGAGARYSKTVIWDQRSGVSRSRVAPGSYELTTRFNGGATTYVLKFTIEPQLGPRTLVATQVDNGRSYVLRRGDRLMVRLSNSSIYNWSVPTSSNSAVLRRLSGASGPVATGSFIAEGSGVVRVSATDTPSCYPQCLPPSRLFELKVSVMN